MLFLIAQIKRLGTLNATQKTSALYTALFLKKSGKTAQKYDLGEQQDDLSTAGPIVSRIYTSD